MLQFAKMRGVRGRGRERGRGGHCVAAAISVRLKPSQLMDKWSKCLRLLLLPLLRPFNYTPVSAFNKQIGQSEAIVELTQMEL